ncbi:DNA-binding death effector domain-containing protein 2 isoform X1 [Bubalus bubalis]|uniref:DNA-binding death effector domain-containing protein 2 isoform X1 n=2 Tax=Bubalus bubalis TaxID=89462 RepID=UPI000DBC6C71|nr:DNA-binding death effector domain-containing protein 2 isoform X1 [Bubalus bubalis]
MALTRSTPAPSWEEDECLDYYGMLSLHRMFEVVGGQLTECELELLAFLLDEVPGAPGGLARARSGLELLLELERRGQCDESNLRLLGQLLRLLSRHDLLPHLARKRRRPVSPERYSYGLSNSSRRMEGSCRRRRQSSSSSNAEQGQWETGSPPTKRQRRSRGRPSGGARRRRRGATTTPQQQQELARPTSEGKVTCAGTSCLFMFFRWGNRLREVRSHAQGPTAREWQSRDSPQDIRLRVRAEYCEHGPALEQGVASRRPQALARQLDVFGQATAVLRSRDLGSVVCDIKFSELSYLDAFWGDYLSGALLQALRGVFLTEALREAVGREAVRLLVSVDEADYEAGRRRLLLMEEEGGRRSPEAS